MKDSIFILLLVGLGCALLYLLKSGIKEARLRISLIEDERLQYALGQFVDVVEAVVASINQTIVDPLKNSSELNFDKEAQARVLQMAKDRIKKDLDNKSFEILNKTFNDLDDRIETAIEAEVRKQKLDKEV
ncbi:hypothetical protein [Anaerococcus cruorum]|uniref:Uncharacterized protein n=1 Tax=Anaerococcus cruorum TaxID=3115617 RepID=A0ABW9MWC9_9FIRM